MVIFFNYGAHGTHGDEAEPDLRSLASKGSGKVELHLAMAGMAMAGSWWTSRLALLQLRGTKWLGRPVRARASCPRAGSGSAYEHEGSMAVEAGRGERERAAARWCSPALSIRCGSSWRRGTRGRGRACGSAWQQRSLLHRRVPLLQLRRRRLLLPASLLLPTSPSSPSSSVVVRLLVTPQARRRG